MRSLDFKPTPGAPRGIGALAGAILTSVLLSACLGGESSDSGSMNGGASPSGASSPTRVGIPSQSLSPITAPVPTVQADGLITTVAVTDRDNQALASRVVT